MVNRCIEKDGNIFPSIFNLVDSLPNDTIHNEWYGYRNPQLIVSRSMNRIFLAFDRVYQENDNTVKFYKLNGKIEDYKIIENLEKAIIELLEAIASFIDDCNTIFKMTSPKYEPRYKMVVTWLKKTKHPYQKVFFEDIKTYHDDLKKYVNELKHQNGKLNIVMGIMGANEHIIGYSLPYMGSTPDDEYREILDLNEINALLIDLKYHFYNVYRISDRFSEFICKSIKHYYNIDLKLKKHYRINEFERVFKRVSETKAVTFPIEAKYNSPQICINYRNSILEIERIGKTDENMEFVVVLNIKDKDPETHKIMLVPKQAYLDEFSDQTKTLAIGESQKTTVPVEGNFNRVFITIHPYKNIQKAYLEYNFENKFYLKVWFSWKIGLIFTSNLDYHEKFIVRFNKKIFDKDESIHHFNLNMSDGSIIKND